MKMISQVGRKASRYLAGVFLILIPLLLPACSRQAAEEKGGEQKQAEQKKSEHGPVDAITKDARERVRANVRDLMKGHDFFCGDEGCKASVINVEDGYPLKNKEGGFTCTMHVHYRVETLTPRIWENGLDSPDDASYTSTFDAILTYDAKGEFIHMKRRQGTAREDRGAAIRKAQDANQKYESQARMYGQDAGQQIMDRVGGGQNLLTSPGGTWKYERHTSKYTIPVYITFQGAIDSTNRYTVEGILTVDADGRNPRFNRTSANQKFRNLENLIRFAEGTIIVLDALSSAKQK